MKWLFGLLACGAVAAQAELRIQEVLYDPTGTDTGLEWVEVVNAGDQACTTAGYLLDASGPNLLLPDVLLQPGQSLVVHNNAATAQAPEGRECWFTGASMGNTHGFVGLWVGEEQTTEALRDYMQWGTTGHSWEIQAIEAGVWPLDAVLPDVEQGHSLRWTGGQGPVGWLDDPAPVAGGGEVDVEARNPPRPARAELLDVWPNPFNPETRVSFRLPGVEHVRLSLADLRGHEVVVLEDGLLAGGVHERRLDLTRHASGCYFLRLQAESGTTVRKVLLVR